jgi:hypothetical protein
MDISAEAHLCRFQHVLDYALHVGRQPLWLEVEQLDQARAHGLPDFTAGIMCQCKQACQVPGRQKKQMNARMHTRRLYLGNLQSLMYWRRALF